LIYGKYSRGYRQGSLAVGGPYGFTSYDPEKVDTYELGMKTSFESFVQGTVNTALFYNDFTDQQLIAGFTDGLSQNASPINAGSSRISGAELETSLRLTNSLTLGLSYAYLDTEITDITTPTVPAGSRSTQVTIPAEEGSQLTFTPRNKVVISLDYLLPLPKDVGQVSATTAYSYTGSMLQVEPDDVVGMGTIPAKELVSANINWFAIYNSAFDASLFVTNLLDKEYKTAVLGIYSSAGFTGEYAGEPRMFGARMRYNFGL